MLYALSRKHTDYFVVLQKARSHRATLWHYREVSRTCSYELLCDATQTCYGFRWVTSWQRSVTGSVVNFPL